MHFKIEDQIGDISFLVALIYESLGNKILAKQYFLKIITQYPENDYNTSALIKIRTFDLH